MIIDTSLSSLEMRRGDVLRLDEAQGATVVCGAGTIWVTRDGEPADHVLSAGEQLRIDGPGRVLIQAFAPSRLTVAVNAVFLAPEPARAAAARRPQVRGRLVSGGAVPMPA